MSAGVDFQKLFEHSPNPYMLLDRELRYVAANRAYLAVTGRRLEELLGRYILEAFPNDPGDPNDEAAGRLRDSLLTVLRTGEPDVLPLIPYRVGRGGETGGNEMRYWSATHTPIRGDNGQVQFVLQHTVDITELQELRNAPPHVEAGVLHRAQRVQEENLALERERRHLAELFAQAPGFVAFLRVPGFVFENANAAYAQLVGHRDVIGKRLADALPEVVDQGFLRLLERVRDTREPVVGRGTRVLLQRAQGEPLAEVFLDFIYQPILDANKEVAGILVQGHDITEQVRLESELAAQVERQRFLAESIPQQVWTATPDGAIDSVNRRVTEYFGVQADAVLGAGWQSVIHPDDLPECVERWRHSLATGENYQVEFRLRRHDGVYRWHLARAHAYRDVQGRISKWFGTNTDVDEVKRARDELQARSELDRQLIGIVSHDLRNPLNAIGMGTALLRQGPLTDQQRKVVDRMMSSFERAGRLIRDFLDFTQARVSGEFPIARSHANVRQIAHQVCEEIQPLYPDRRCAVEHTGRETGDWDPDRLAQLMGNLVSNAFQHSPSDGTVTVRSNGGPDRLLVSVHNFGEPIPPADLHVLFKPFQRGSNATTSTSRNVGLGLYICEQIVTAHGGTISVESSRPAGTTFTFTLPYGR